jgi:hypothetical protein
MRVPNDFQGFRLGCQRATRLSEIYGEYAYDFVETIFSDLHQLAEYLGMPYSSEFNIARRALWVWEFEVVPYCEQHGVPYPLRMIDFFHEFGCLGRTLGDPDDEEAERDRYFQNAREMSEVREVYQDGA